MRHIPSKNKVRAAIVDAYQELLERIPQATGSEKNSLISQANKIELAIKSWKGAVNG